MAKPAFTWDADLGAQRSVKPSINQTKFGDGYELRVPIGINFKPKTWSVTFTRDLAVASAILNFLDARGGSEAFTWVDPMNVDSTYVCREWSSSQSERGIYTITATFEQVFES